MSMRPWSSPDRCRTDAADATADDPRDNAIDGARAA